MPLPPTAAQIRLNNIVTSLNAAVTTVDVVTKSLKTGFLSPMANTVHSLLTAVQVIFSNQSVLLVFTEICQTVKRNQDDCAQMLEQFARTLHKIHTFIEAEQEKSKIKHFFRQGEMKALQKACHTGLEQALEMFKASSLLLVAVGFLTRATLQIQGAKVLSDMVEMQEHAQKTHKEVLELLSALSDSESGSSISRVLSSSHNSSNSFSLLPSEPKIFHGRESEISIIIQQLNQHIPRVAILGGGGMGKTSLARAVLHHPQISAKYEKHRFFVACDAASSSVHLAALIGAHVGLQPGQDLTKPVIWYFSNGPPSLLILDNLETVWEPKESRANVEKLLALLEDIEHLTLIITMRGAERPASVRWTHPFLLPLQPLAQDAARKTFIDIVDDGCAVEDIDKILLLADNMPLAIDLIAHLVDYNGFESVMQHWETGRTSLLSEGPNKGSNLDLSITMSLESPRLASVPHARDLLSLLSMLPDGLADADLLQSRLPIKNVLACKSALLCTSLAYTDDQKQLKALVPIREYMQKMHPPLTPMVQPLHEHFSKLLEVYETYHGTAPSPGIIARITSNFANIQNVLLMGLTPDNRDLVKTIYSTCHFDRFSRQTGHGQIELIHRIPTVLPHPRDHRVEVYWMMTVISGYNYHIVPNRQHIVDQSLSYFSHFDDPDLECQCYHALAEYSFNHNIPKATSLAQNGLSLAISTGNPRRQANMLTILAWIKWKTGDSSAGREHASESQRLARISGNLYAEANALRLESICWCTLGSYDQSILLTSRARELLGLCAMSGGQLDNSLLHDQAEVHVLKSEYVDAHVIHTQILLAVPIEQNQYQHALALLTMAQIDVEISSLKDRVHRTIDAAKQLFSLTGSSMEILFCDMIAASLYVNEGDFLKAKTLFQTCLKFMWGKHPQGVSYCLEKLGNASLWHSSSSWTVILLVHSLKLKQKLEIHKALQFLGDVYLADGDQVTAINLFAVALEGFTNMDVHRSRAECMLRLGDIAEANEDLSKAGELWNTARPLFERSSQVKQVGHIDERLTRISQQPLFQKVWMLGESLGGL
ncbi:hypothetical protein FB451DRAFT_1164307 [Mycena latifolia]|nr:hypothetical protein FB451DRAFT_1164307 [Mycena latifolia]